MKFLLSTLFFFLLLNVSAQRVVDVTKNDRVDQGMFNVVGGQPFVNVKFVQLMSGSPYFRDDWMMGNILDASGQLYRGGLLKLDLLDNEILFVDGSGKEMIATIPVKEIALRDTVTNTVYHFVHSTTIPSFSSAKKGWYLKLASGKATLFQFINKVMRESKPYGSATVEQTINTVDQFFILHNNELLPIKKLKDAPSVFGNKSKELEKFLETSKGSTADKLTAMVKYYNSLPQ